MRAPFSSLTFSLVNARNSVLMLQNIICYSYFRICTRLWKFRKIKHYFLVMTQIMTYLYWLIKSVVIVCFKCVPWCCCWPSGDGQCLSSIQHAADTSLPSVQFADVSCSAGTASAVCSESAVVVDAGVRQRQSAEEHALECRPQSVLGGDSAVATRRDIVRLLAFTWLTDVCH